MRASLALLAALCVSACVAGSDSSSSSSSSSSDTEHCNPLNVLHDMVSAFNERRFDDLAKLYTNDALFYMNGELNLVTRGRPYTPAEHVCVAEKLHMRVSIDVAGRDDDSVVSAALTLTIGGVERVNVQTGLGLVLDIAPSACKIQTERHYLAQNSIAFQQLLAAQCDGCLPNLVKYGLCGGATPPPERPQVDIVKQVGDCWAFAAAGNAQGIASCYAPGAIVRLNGITVDEDRSRADFWEPMFAGVQISDVRVLSTIQEGFRVHAVVEARVTDRASGYSVLAHFAQNALFNEAGEVVSFDEAWDDNYAGLLLRMQRVAPSTDRWVHADAVQGFLATFAELGYPTFVTNRGDGIDFAYWGRDHLENTCFAEVWAADESVRHFPLSAPAQIHQTFLHATGHLEVADDLLNAVRSITPAVTYDQLKRLVHSRASSMARNKLNLWIVAKVASGQMTLAEARAMYAQSLATVDDVNSEIRARVEAELCLLVHA